MVQVMRLWERQKYFADSVLQVVCVVEAAI